MKRPEDFTGYEENWEENFNMNEERAKSMYDIEKKETCRKGSVNGNIRVAFWSEIPGEAPGDLYYNQNTSAKATVASVRCAGDQRDDDTNPIQFVGDNATNIWGTVASCDNGPRLSTLVDGSDDADAPPMLILNRTDGHTFLIVEESSNNPSFLYSVWTNNGAQFGNSTELSHLFYIAATMRLAEAVVTAIVQGKTSGRECFFLVRVNSRIEDDIDSEDKSDGGSKPQRAKPFGEDPTNELVRIEELETIECGLEIDLKALICLVILILLTSIGITWSFCLRSSIGMNVYDRDELIRAVSMSVNSSSSTAPSAIRIFVRKEDCGSLSVVISDADDAETGCNRLLRLRRSVVEDSDPTTSEVKDDPFDNPVGGATVPAGPRAVSLGVRTGMGRPWPGPNNDYIIPTGVALSTSSAASCSPVPSPSCVLVATVFQPSPLSRVPREGPALAETGRGASVLFDAPFSPSDSGKDEPDDMRTDRNNENDNGGAPCAQVEGPVGERGPPASPQAVAPPDIETSSVMDLMREGWNSILRISSRRPMLEARGGASSVAPLNRQASHGPPTLGPLTQTWQDETKE